MYSYQKGGYETVREDALRFAKEKYFNGHSDARSAQKNFNPSFTIQLISISTQKLVGWFPQFLESLRDKKEDPQKK